jgi:hypothetical protein
MITQESHTLLESISSIRGFDIASLDAKHRFSLGKWAKNYPPGSELILIYAGDFAILIGKNIFDNYSEISNLIPHPAHVDDQYRVLLPKNFLHWHSIVLEENIYLLGKWNHLVLYFSKESYNKTPEAMSVMAAKQLEISLVLNT